MEPLEIVAMISELLAWFGIPVGVILLASVLFMHAYDGGWLPTDLVVVDGPDGPVARWFAEGEFYERPLHPDERERVEDAEAHRAFYSRNAPAVMRFESRRPSVQVLRALGILLLALGVVGLVVAIVLLFVI